MKHKNLSIARVLLLLFCLTPATVKGGEESDEVGEKNHPPAAQSQPARPSKAPMPTFHNLRFEEDWSPLKSNSPLENYQKLKFIPLNSTSSSFLSLGGQLRFRAESWRDFGFGGAGNRDETFGLFRLRLHGDLWLGPRFRVFVEGKSSLSTERDLPGGHRTLDVDTADFQNALVDVRASLEPVAVTFRLGRQEMQLGRQRLVSPLDWGNTRRTFDAARAVIRSGSWRIDGFWARLVATNKYSLNSSCDPGVDLFGIYSTGRLGNSGLNADFYWLGLERDQATWGDISGSESRQSLGGRLAGKIGQSRTDFDVEATFQFGEHQTRDIRAAMIASQLGYTFQATGSPRIYTGFDYATGDDDPADDKVQSFNQLFPLGHAYLGYIDIVGRQNIVDWSLGLAFSPLSRINLGFTAHNFWRADTSDALYNAGGGVVRSGTSSEARRIGLELDLTAGYRINRHWALNGGYSHFFAGEFIEESGSSDAIDFAFFSIQATF